MSEPSNPTSRVIAVLNFLAAHPTESFSLAEIARRVGLSNGSAHRILLTLAGAKFLARNEKQRSYSLGMAMVAIGQAAVEKHRGIAVARREVARLAAELGTQCSASTVVEGEILVLVKEGSAQSHRGLTRVGERRPLVVPLGMCHVAWSGAAGIAAYVGRAAPQLAPAALARLEESFALIRRRGFAIAAYGPASALSRAAMVLPADRSRDDAYWASLFAMIGQLTPDEVQLRELAAPPPEGIASIAAPVFAPDGTVALQLVISGLPASLAIGDIARHAERLCAAAATITSETHGRRPG